MLRLSKRNKRPKFLQRKHYALKLCSTVIKSSFCSANGEYFEITDRAKRIGSLIAVLSFVLDASFTRSKSRPFSATMSLLFSESHAFTKTVHIAFNTSSFSLYISIVFFYHF